MKRFIIICGHYGCGKTNFALNYALQLAKEGEKVTLCDLDIVNPYFCSVEHKDELKAAGVNFISTTYAGTNLDLPSIPAEMYSVFNSDDTIIFDVGGDDAGAAVLGRFHEHLSQIDYEMFYVINKYRTEVDTPEEAKQLLSEIETASRCKATAVVNNSHLKQETIKETILSSVDYAKKAAEVLGLPLLFTTVPVQLYMKEKETFDNTGEKFLPVEVIVKAPWE